MIMRECRRHGLESNICSCLLRRIQHLISGSNPLSDNTVNAPMGDPRMRVFIDGNREMVETTSRKWDESLSVQDDENRLHYYNILFVFVGVRRVRPAATKRPRFGIGHEFSRSWVVLIFSTRSSRFVPLLQSLFPPVTHHTSCSMRMVQLVLMFASADLFTLSHSNPWARPSSLIQ